MARHHDCLLFFLNAEGIVERQKFLSKIQLFYLMSHFISGVNLEGSLIFHMTPPQIVKPRMKRFLKSNTLETFFGRKKQSKIIDHVCQRYSQIEQENLKVQKELFISNKCSTLKRKFKSSFNPNASGKTVETFFNDNSMTLEQRVRKFPMNLKELAMKMPRRLQLQKKYNSNINIKMISIQEAEMINRQKEEYRQWLNESNNCINSPNLNKMTYLFEKMAAKQAKLKTHTQNSQLQQLPDFENALSTTRKDMSRLQMLLKENGNQKCYGKKHRKPYTSLDKERNRHSANDIELYRY